MSDDPKKINSKFWLDDPSDFFCSFNFCPNNTMSKDEKLNSITWLVLIITVILFFLEIKAWLIFLLVSIIFILVIKYGLKKKDNENFTIVPTYMSTDFEQTTVAPLFSEEWQVYPPAYDLYENIPPDDVTFDAPIKPQSYPYGQYLTTTNLLPSDEQHIRMLNGGLNNAKEYANSTYLRNDLAYRDNMMRIHKKKLERRFRNNGTNDSFSPYHSF
jgi:hypothetical protein